MTDVKTAAASIPASRGSETNDLNRAASSLLNQLWQTVYSAARSFEENWAEMERRFPASKWLQDELKEAAASKTPDLPTETVCAWPNCTCSPLAKCPSADASPAPQPVQEQEPVALTGFDEAASAAWDFVRPKLLEMNREKGPAGVWSTGYRSGWDAAMRTASPPEQEPVVNMIPDPPMEVLRAMHEAMFVEEWDATQAPMVGSAYDAARAALGVRHDQWA